MDNFDYNIQKQLKELYREGKRLQNSLDRSNAFKDPDKVKKNSGRTISCKKGN